MKKKALKFLPGYEEKEAITSAKANIISDSRLRQRLQRKSSTQFFFAWRL